MNHKFTLLSPVKEEDFKLIFGNATPVEGEVDPVKLFEPTLNHFRRIAIGTYFWFIADPIKWIVHTVGGMMEKMTPIKEKDLVNQSPDALFKNTHPEDIPQVLAFSNYWVKYFTALPSERKSYVSATIYIRLLNTSKSYNWMMIQYADSVVNAEGKIVYGLTLITDISHIKKDGPAMMSILDRYNDDCQQFYCIDGGQLTGETNIVVKISAREQEILRFLAQGCSSKEIASRLKVSNKTVENHRYNLLRKTDTKSTGALVAYGINMGLI